MQVVIYADILFVFNSIVTFMLLNLTSDFLRNETDYGRMILGAVVGGAYSLIIFAPEIKPVVAIIIRIIMLISIVLITFRVISQRKFFRCIIVFLLTSFVFSGLMYFFAFTLLKNKVLVKNGCIYFDTGPFGIILFVSGCFILLKVLKKIFLSKKNTDLIFDLYLINGKKSIMVRALFDSGNTVKDPFSGKPVIIINLKNSVSFLEGDIYTGLEQILKLKRFDRLPEGVRLLPVNALGHSDLIPALTVDSAVIEYDTNRITVRNPTLAFTDNSFDNKKYSALINESVLKGDLIGIT